MRVSHELPENRYAERVGDSNILSCLERQVCHGKFVGVIETCGVGHRSRSGCPVDGSQPERYVNFKITAESPVSTVVESVVAREVGVPLETCEIKVISYVGLKHVVGFVGFILEITCSRVKSVISPLVCYTYVKSAYIVTQRKIYLFRVIRVGKSDRAPSCKFQPFPPDA